MNTQLQPLLTGTFLSHNAILNLLNATPNTDTWYKLDEIGYTVEFSNGTLVYTFRWINTTQERGYAHTSAMAVQSHWTYKLAELPMTGIIEEEEFEPEF